MECIVYGKIKLRSNILMHYSLSLGVEKLILKSRLKFKSKQKINILKRVLFFKKHSELINFILHCSFFLFTCIILIPHRLYTSV